MEHITFYNVKKTPFSLHGLYQPQSQGVFCRLPQDVATATSENVSRLHLQTTGGRVRFKTDSARLVIKAKTGRTAQNFHTSPLLESGFDVYVDGTERSVYVGSARPAFAQKSEYIFELPLPQAEKELTLYMPAYGELETLEIGLDRAASLAAHSPYRTQTPIVFYGSSITHGCCASRPGKTYPAILSRRFDLEFINLGFAGSCKGEQVLAEYMAGLDMCAFVSDYDHNRSCAQKLAENHYQLYEIIREKHPDIPYYMISRPDFTYSEKDFARRAVVMESYLKAWHGGDRNVYFIDGSAFFNGAESKLEYTVDGTHPTDEGFARMASYIGGVFAETLQLEKLK